MALADRVADHEAPEIPSDDFQELLRFFAEFADGSHHNREADIVYPWVASACDRGASASGRLLHDHHATREALQALHLYRRCRSLPDLAERNAFVTACRTYGQRLVGHMADEEETVFAAAATMAPEDQESLRAALGAPADTASWKATLDQLATRLRSR